MNIIPEVQCRRCGETFSSLRSRCPNCGTRRVAQSGRTPGTTPGTVKGTAAYERAETNTKWQLIFGLILVVAVILAVIVMVSTSLDGADNGIPSGTKVTASPSPSSQGVPIVEAPPTPPPTPTPSVEKVQIRYATTESLEFTMRMGDAPITVNAVAFPVTIENPVFEWSCSNTDCMKITVSEDTKECTCEILAPIAGGVKLKVSCFGVEQEIPVYLRD